MASDKDGDLTLEVADALQVEPVRDECRDEAERRVCLATIGDKSFDVLLRGADYVWSTAWSL